MDVYKKAIGDTAFSLFDAGSGLVAPEYEQRVHLSTYRVVSRSESTLVLVLETAQNNSPRYFTVKVIEHS